MDRKHYSKRRELALWRLVDHAITDLRIEALRGLFSYNEKANEQKLIEHLSSLPDMIAAEYRKSFAPVKHAPIVTPVPTAMIDWKPEAKRLRDEDSLVAAVKYCRTITGWRLQESKEAVEAL